MNVFPWKPQQVAINALFKSKYQHERDGTKSDTLDLMEGGIKEVSRGHNRPLFIE